MRTTYPHVADNPPPPPAGTGNGARETINRKDFMKSITKQKFFGLTLEQDKWLSQEAELRHISRSALIRALIDGAREGDHASKA
jgi:hypothetical protein